MCSFIYADDSWTKLIERKQEKNEKRQREKEWMWEMKGVWKIANNCQWMENHENILKLDIWMDTLNKLVWSLLQLVSVFLFSFRLSHRRKFIQLGFAYFGLIYRFYWTHSQWALISPECWLYYVKSNAIIPSFILENSIANLNNDCYWHILMR